MSLLRFLVASAFAVSFTNPASAKPPPEPYPLTATVVLAPEAGWPMFSRPAPAATEVWPPEPHGTVNLEAQTRAAYAAVGARMFRGGASGAEIELSVALSAAGIEQRSGGSLAFVEHDVVLRVGGGEVARWRLRGEERFLATRERSMEYAFARAAAVAADELEVAFEDPPEVASWLRGRGIPSRDPGRPRRTPAPRSGAPVFFVDPGIGFVTYGVPRTFGEESSRTAVVSARAGLSSPILLALRGAYWEVAHPSFQTANFSVTSVGVDLAAAIRATGNLELVGGGGFEKIRVQGSLRSSGERLRASGSKAGGSLFAGLVHSGCIARRLLCARFGVEVRSHLLTPVELMGPSARWPFEPFSLDAAKLEVGFFGGIELPLPRPQRRSAP